MTEARQTRIRSNFLRLSLLSMCVALVWSFEIFHVNASQCGKVFKLVPLIYGGDSARRNDWPFLAALYQVIQNQNTTIYFCGGTVISTKHILTAAHCFQGKGSSYKLPSDLISVKIGAFNLTVTNEHGAVSRNVRKVHIHPEWDVYSNRYDADIAILLLSESVTFSHYIQPVCMPPDDVIVDGATINDVEGYIVGWGFSHKERREEIPRHAIVHAINDSYCYREQSHVGDVSSPRTFCSGKGNGVPNIGDSGGGFFVLKNSAWMQYGVISVLHTNGTGHVSPDSLSAYTNVKMFKDWILETVAFQEKQINLNCSYSMSTQNEYACWLSGLNIRAKYVEVASLSGHHTHGRTIYNVEALVFTSGSLFYLPYKIGDFFVNLRRLYISPLKTKLIRRSDLKNLEKLMYLTIDKNEIQFLESDCLWDLPQLTAFRISENKIKSIDGKSFERNPNIREVHLYGNLLEKLPRNLFNNNAMLKIVRLDQNRLQMLPRNLFQANALLETIQLNDNSLNILNENTFINNAKLKILHLHSNKLEILPANVFQINTLLEIISLSMNSLTSIPENIFGSNTKLKNVYLYSNQFETLPANLFQKNSLLELISLYNNSLKSIPENIFGSNTKLKEVHLYSNQIETLPANLFQKNSLLEKVSLNNNNLKSIPENIFGSNTNLKEVYLRYNQLETLPENLFRTNTLLENIWLQHNPLKIIATNFNGLNNIKNIFLGDTSCTTFSFDRLGQLSLPEFQASIRANCSYISNPFSSFNIPDSFTKTEPFGNERWHRLIEGIHKSYNSQPSVSPNQFSSNLFASNQFGSNQFTSNQFSSNRFNSVNMPERAIRTEPVMQESWTSCTGSFCQTTSRQTGSMNTGSMHTSSMNTGPMHTGSMQTGSIHTGNLFTGYNPLSQTILERATMQTNPQNIQIMGKLRTFSHHNLEIT